MLLAFHKPYGVLCRFTPDGSAHATLAGFGLPADVYPIGRLDADSEGLLLLSDEARWNADLLSPGRHIPKTYLALVERMPSPGALERLAAGIDLDGKKTLPAQARVLDPPPEISARIPPVRFRKNVCDVWIELQIVEGRNRQVRRMTAAVGHPTLRLIRTGIGGLWLGGLQAGAWREVPAAEIRTA